MLVWYMQNSGAYCHTRANTDGRRTHMRIKKHPNKIIGKKRGPRVHIDMQMSY